MQKTNRPKDGFTRYVTKEKLQTNNSRGRASRAKGYRGKHKKKRIQMFYIFRKEGRLYDDE